MTVGPVTEAVAIVPPSASKDPHRSFRPISDRREVGLHPCGSNAYIDRAGTSAAENVPLNESGQPELPM